MPLFQMSSRSSAKNNSEPNSELNLTVLQKSRKIQNNYFKDNSIYSFINNLKYFFLNSQDSLRTSELITNG